MKVLILSATVGGGHMACANAINDYLSKQSSIDVKIADGIELSGHTLNKIIVSSYKFMAKKSPFLFRIIYNLSDKRNPFCRFISYFFYKKSKKLLSIINSFNPDIIISTHPFCMEMVASLKEKGIITLPLINIMTDYVPHQTWINDKVDEYIVAADDMLPEMIDRGVASNKINPYGIPVKSQFFNKYDKDILKHDLDLEPNIPIILLMAGSFGVKDVFSIYMSILSICEEFQVVLISGNNQKLYNKFQLQINNLNKLKKDTKHTKLIKFTDQIAKYMQSADLLITKPGGLTISEALASNLPMALFKPIPGQEDGNQAFLLHHNMALTIDSHCAKEIVEDLLKDTSKLKHLKEACCEFDKSDSCKNILDKLNLYC